MKTFEIDFAGAVSQFERAIKRFKVKKIIYKTIFRGKGLEFDRYRNFEPDDDSDRIDWKASLRANKLLTRQYIEERDLDFYFIVDCSSSMVFGSGNKLKAEYAAEIVAALSHLVLSSDDNAGLVMFSDDIVKVLRPSKSMNQFYLFLKFLSDSELYKNKVDFENVIDYALRTIKSPFSVIVLISDFFHINKNFEKIKLLSTKFETMALMVRDPLDEDLPKLNYQLILQDPHSERQILVDPAIASKSYRENAIKQKRFVENLFKESKVDLLELKTDRSFVIPLVSFLAARARSGGR